jgi:anti-sigma regulatory factor (Ser/Thr protein kinase)
MGSRPVEPIRLDGGVSESYPAVAESISRAREALAGLATAAGACSDEVDAIRTAVSEAMTNAVLHAYRGSGTGRVHVAATVAGCEFWILVADDGGGLRVRPDSPGLGFGLTLIAQVCDEFTILERAAGGTEVQMRISLARAGAARRDHSRGSVPSATAPA